MIASMVLMVACGKTPAPVARQAEPEEKDRTEIQTGPAKVWLPGSWTMDVVDSQVAFIGEKDSQAVVQSVKGSLLSGEKIQSRFTAKEGIAETSSGRLVLMGKVRVTSEADDIVLVADRVVYDEKSSLITAEGSVVVVSATWESGPFDHLVATASLERIGTPDRFQ